MKPMPTVIQYELSPCRDAFNLAGEEEVDPVRLMHEQLESEHAKLEAEAYALKYQRQLSECPGFFTCDPPRGPQAHGKVVIEPAFVQEAVKWLKRRFHIAETLELSTDQGLCIELKPRIKSTGKAPRVKVNFNPPEQFKLEF